MTNADMVFSKAELYSEFGDNATTIVVHINRLRGKLKKVPAIHNILKTVSIESL